MRRRTRILFGWLGRLVRSSCTMEVQGACPVACTILVLWPSGFYCVCLQGDDQEGTAEDDRQVKAGTGEGKAGGGRETGHRTLSAAEVRAWRDLEKRLRG